MGHHIAAVIVEPVIGNANCIPPQPGYLQHLRTLCTQYAVLLIFDEVMTGFRVALGGAQALYGVTPDLTTFGKIIGGGMPVGAYGGRRDLMQHIAPTGPIYQAGTLSGNPVAMAAGLAMLELIQAPDFYTHLSNAAAALCTGLQQAASQAGIAMTTQQIGGMFGLFLPINRWKPMPKRPPAIPTASTASSTRCCNAACFLPHQRMKQDLSPAPIHQTS